MKVKRNFIIYNDILLCNIYLSMTTTTASLLGDIGISILCVMVSLRDQSKLINDSYCYYLTIFNRLYHFLEMILTKVLWYKQVFPLVITVPK